MTIGLPGSGKDFWYKQIMEKENPGIYKRINKDDLRTLLDLGKWSNENEKFIIKARDNLIELALQDGWSVICTDTNLAEKHQIALSDLAKKHGVEFMIQDFRNIPLDECIKRDQKRSNYVGEKVIRQMYNQFLKPKPIIVQQVEGAKRAIVCDIDGTLALFGDANPYDRDFDKDVINDSVRYVLEGNDQFNEIIFVSGRSDKFRKVTEEWLSRYGFGDYPLFMRKDGDSRKDVIIKSEIYNKHIKDKYNVLFVLDDRDQVVEFWRSQGLTCLQVAEGNF